MLEALAAKHLPGQEANENTLGTALFLERHYWDNYEIATANAIAKAFKG
jgi:hypothetical protein